MRQVVEYKKSPLLRRFAAFFIDLVIAVLALLLVDTILTTPIVNATTDYDETYELFYDTLVDSHLYIYDEKGNIAQIRSNYDENIVKFYEKYDDVENYYKLKLESNLFDYDEANDKWTVKENALESDVTIFYLTTIANAEYKILYEVEDIKNMTIKLSAYNDVMFLINAFIGITITFLVVPLISKSSATVGMKPFYLCVVNKNNGEFASKTQVLFRYLVILSMYGFLSLYTMGLPLIVSGVMILFTKERQSLPDLLCSTYTVDDGQKEAQILEKDQILIIYDDGKQEEKK